MSAVRDAAEAVTRPAARAVDERLLLASVLALGAALRFTGLGAQSFWNDEAVTWESVHGSLGHLLHAVPSTESTPPLYYVLVWLWSRVFGAHEAALRSFSALCGTITIALVWAAGRRLVGARVGLIAALLSAVSPLLFWYSQEARAYALLVMLSALSLLALAYVLESPRPARALAWGLACALALATHYFAMIVILPEAAWLLLALRGRGMLRTTTIAAGGVPVIAASAALTPLLLHQNNGAHLNWLSSRAGSLPHRVLVLARDDVIGSQQPARPWLALAAGLLVAAALLLLVLRASPRERLAARGPLAVGAGAIVLAVAISATVTDYVNTRNLIASWPMLAILVACGLGTAALPRRGIVLTSALAGLGLICIIAVLLTPSLQRPDWRGAARSIGPAEGSRALISGRLSYIYHSLTPYMSGLSHYPRAGTPVREIDVISLAQNQWGGLPTPPAVKPATSPPPGFRLAARLKTDSYTVWRYVAGRPVVLTPAMLANVQPGLSPGEVALQRA